MEVACHILLVMSLLTLQLDFFPRFIEKVERRNSIHVGLSIEPLIQPTNTILMQIHSLDFKTIRK
jgi:hypothetical protein